MELEFTLSQIGINKSLNELARLDIELQLFELFLTENNQ